MIGQPRHAGDRAKLNSNTNRDGTKLDLFPFCFRPHDNRDRSIAIPVVSILIGTEGFQKSGGHNSPEEPFAWTIDVATSAPFASNDDPSAVKGCRRPLSLGCRRPLSLNRGVEGLGRAIGQCMRCGDSDGRASLVRQVPQVESMELIAPGGPFK